MYAVNSRYRVFQFHRRFDFYFACDCVWKLNVLVNYICHSLEQLLIKFTPETLPRAQYAFSRKWILTFAFRAIHAAAAAWCSYCANDRNNLVIFNSSVVQWCKSK